MPRAPSIIPNIPQQPIGARGYSAPEVTPQRDFTGQLLAQQGQALQRAGESIGTYANEVRLQTARATAQEQSTFLHEQFRTSESEFGAKLGRDAVDGFADYEAKARKRIADEVAKISDPDAKRIVFEEGQRRLQRSLDWATNHRDAQLASWRTSSTEAAVNEEAMSAYEAKLRGDEKGYEEAKGRSVAKAEELARIKGFDEVQTRRVVEAANNLTHAGVIDGYVERGKGFEAWGYLEKHKGEMSPSLYEDRRAKTRAAMIEEGARLIDSTVSTIDERLTRVREMVADGQLTPEDGESATRHLLQFDAERKQERAIVAKDVRARGQAWRNQFPHLNMETENPGLAAEVAAAGVVLDREVSNPVFQQYMRTPRGMQELRAMTPEVLDYTLRNQLSPRDAGEAEKFIRGDQSGYTISQLTKSLAIHAGVIPAQSKYGEAGKDEQALLEWEMRTIEPMVSALRQQLGRPITAIDFQEKILDPLTKDTVMVKATSWFGSDQLADAMAADQPMSVMQAQQAKQMPLDNPDTPDVDESLDMKNANVYVQVDGQTVYLNEITMQERRDIRAAWKATNPGTYLSAQQEARLWLQGAGAGKARGQVGVDRNRAMLEIQMGGNK